MKRRVLFVLAIMAALTCLLAIGVSAEVDPNAEYYDKVYVNDDGVEFPIYELEDGIYYPLVWFAYDIKGTDPESGEEVVVETKYIKARYEDISIYSLEPSQGRFNGCFYTYVAENGEEIELNTSNLVVLNLRAGVMAKTHNGSKKQNGTNIRVDTIETNRTDIFPVFSRLEAVYIPLVQTRVGSLDLSTLRVCDIDKNQSAIAFGNKAFQNSKVKEIFVPGGSTFGGNSTFQGCTKLEKIVFGNGYTADIPGYFFDRCTSLKEICFMDGLDAVNAVNIATSNNGYYINATRISAGDYEALEEKSGIYLIYDCTLCDAFGHSISENKIAIVDDFFAPVRIACTCAVEGCDEAMDVDTIAPLFKNELGYSAKAFGEGLALVCGYGVNREAIGAYLSYAPDFDFGILAFANGSEEAVQPKPGEDRVVDISFDNMANDYIEVKLTGIPETERDTRIIFCAYATVGGKIYYLENGVTSESALGVRYNDFAE